MEQPKLTILCGDCNAPDPTWATLNRGLLLCNDCYFIHRSIGPQYSKLKCLKNSQWHPNLRKLVMQLAAGSANNVWEHCLIDPTTKNDLQIKKPSPSDTLEVKKQFILRKHFHCQFVLRQKADTIEDRNKELHSTVRTSDIGTTLRLLAAGANPNYFHPEKGTKPVHVAARTGQSLQIELLFLHGSWTDGTDYLGQTPVEHALAANFKDLAQRILELRYYLTDQLTFFISKKLPDHSTNKHILIPNIQYQDPEILTKHEASIKKLSSSVLEQISQDIYDEVDRRQLEKDNLLISPNGKKYSIAFLPVDKRFCSIRNQSRQKFARLTDEELSALIFTILKESKRRHCNGMLESDNDADKDIFLSNEVTSLNISENGSGNSVTGNTLKIPEDDDFPLYDSVASDEDLDLILAEKQTILPQQKSTLEETALSSNPIEVSNCEVKNGVQNFQSNNSEAKIKELEEINQNLKLEIMVLQRMVGSIIHENLELKSKLIVEAPLTESILVNGHKSPKNGSIYKPNPPPRLKPIVPNRPSSMFEEKTMNIKEGSLPVRPNTTTGCYPKKDAAVLINNSDAVHETTRKIVEMIKVLIEYAQSCDIQGILLTTNKIYDAAQELSYNLLLKDTKKEIRESLENVIVQTIRMRSEIFLIQTEFNKKNFNATNSQDIITDTLVQKVKQICFEVGAAMKKLVSHFPA